MGGPLLARGLLGVFDISLCDEVVVRLITCGRLVLGQGAKVHHILEDEVVGQKEEQGDQRDGEEGEEVNGEVESIRETHNDMTHGTCA